MKTKQELITIPKQEYENLKMKAKIADDAITQLNLSLGDLRHGRVSKFDDDINELKQSKTSQITK